MDKQPTFEKVYEAYKSSRDKVMLIDGVKYFKIIEKNKIGNLQIIVIPIDVFCAKGNIMKDEKENVFTVVNLATYLFSDNIPDCYLKTASVVLKDIAIDKIADYVTLVEWKHFGEN